MGALERLQDRVAFELDLEEWVFSLREERVAGKHGGG